MSIQTEIDRIISAVDAAHAKVAEKGGTTARPYLVANLANAIDTIPGAADPKLQNKTATPTTSQQTIKPDSGYDGLSQVTVNAMPTATQATPSISVSSGGLITASATQTAGYVAAGTKSATKQLTTQAAQTITPGTSNKTIESGRYLTGTQTIKGDANLVADNIKSGVSIFGVTGTLTGGEDVTAETNAYTNLLDDLEAAIDTLPDAGSGGGGSEVCNVAFVFTGYPTNTIRRGSVGCSFIDGENQFLCETKSPSSLSNSVLNVKCNSILTITCGDALSWNNHIYITIDDETKGWFMGVSDEIGLIAIEDFDMGIGTMMMNGAAWNFKMPSTSRDITIEFRVYTG